MRQSSVTHANQAAPTEGLKPTLQAVLGCLDLQLEEELARYRRLKAGYSAPPRRVLGQRSPTPSPIDLFQPSATPSAHSRMASAPIPTAAASAVSPLPYPVASPSVSPPAVPTAPPPPPGPPAAVGPSPTSVLHLSTPHAAAAASPASPTPTPPLAAEAVSPAVQIPAGESPAASPPAAFHALTVVPAPPPVPPADTALAPAAPPAPETPLPDDYLASSEALLKSLAEEEAQDDAFDTSQIKPHGGLLSPLGLGSLLLLLLSSLSIGYALLNPTSLRFLNPSLQGSEATPQPGNPATPTTLPNVPNLATDEFVDLKLDTLGTLAVPSPSPTASPSASPSPTASPSASPSPSSTVANPLLAPSATSSPPIETIPLRVVQPTPRSQNMAPAPIAPRSQPAPAPRSRSVSPGESRSVPPGESTPSTPTSALPRLPVPATAAPAPTRVPVVTPTVSSPSPSQAARSNAPRNQPDTYNVVTDYRGNDSLAQLQQVAPGAYLRNFNDGIRVQLGTFDDRASAQNMVEQLNQQGVAAKIQAE